MHKPSTACVKLIRAMPVSWLRIQIFNSFFSSTKMKEFRNAASTVSNWSASNLNQRWSASSILPTVIKKIYTSRQEFEIWRNFSEISSSYWTWGHTLNAEKRFGFCPSGRWAKKALFAQEQPLFNLKHRCLALHVEVGAADHSGLRHTPCNFKLPIICQYPWLWYCHFKIKYISDIFCNYFILSLASRKIFWKSLHN